MTNLRDLPLGTRFFVHNGNWYGSIGGTQEQKTIFVEATGETYPMDDRADSLIVDMFESPDRPYSQQDYEEAKQQGLDLDDWNDYVKYYGLGEEVEYE